MNLEPLCLVGRQNARMRKKGGNLAKVLLVEDNEMNINMLSRRLERKGLQVVVAKDGLEGVSMAGNESPDVILMDLSLPEIDGREATRRIKSAAETASIPVVGLRHMQWPVTGKRYWTRVATILYQSSRT